MQQKQVVGTGYVRAAGLLMLAAAVSCHAQASYHASSGVRRFPAVQAADVKTGHWAAPYVQTALASGLMSLTDGKDFHGEAKVTRQAAAIMLAHLAQALDTGKWQAQASRPVSPGVLKPLEHGDWATQRVTRYEMAKILVSMGDYVANGLPHAPPTAKNLGKSQALPDRAALKVPRSNAAYAALTYLGEGRMMTPKSPLLKADAMPILGGELSQALAEMVTGLVDRQTDLGLDEEGSTPDKTFHAKPTDKTSDKSSNSGKPAE